MPGWLNRSGKILDKRTVFRYEEKCLSPTPLRPITMPRFDPGSGPRDWVSPVNTASTAVDVLTGGLLERLPQTDDRWLEEVDF